MTEHIYVKYAGSGKPAEFSGMIITLHAEQAFGDGHHPTTKLCAELIVEECTQKKIEELQDMSLVDIGTGTGILAILAQKLGVAAITLMDNDSVAVDTSKKNLKLNDIAHYDIEHADLHNYSNANTYDIVVANVLTIVIEQNINKITAMCKQDGIIVVSGISDDWSEYIKGIFVEHNLIIKDHKSLDGWHAFKLEIARSVL